MKQCMTPDQANEMNGDSRTARAFADASHRAAIESLEPQLFPTVPKSQNADIPFASPSVTTRAG